MQVIPKVFHTVWVQGQLPDEYRAWHESWLTFHPGWEHVVWSEPDYLEHISDCNQEIYGTAVNHAQRAEIMQKELLWRFGGVWIDADFECLRNIEELLDGVECFSAEESPGQISAGIAGCVPGHPAMWSLVEGVTPGILHQRERGLAQNHGAGPYLWQRLWRQRNDVVLFRPEQFYPYRWDEPRPESYGPEAYAVHHWKATWKQ